MAALPNVAKMFEKANPLNQRHRDAAIAFVHGTPAGIGGLGIQSANAAAGLASNGSVIHAFGPGHVDRWPISSANGAITWHEPSRVSSGNNNWRRWFQGRLQFERDTTLGRWAVGETEQLLPRQVYTFTQVGLEVLRWAGQRGVPSVLESPNGHIRNFREVYEVEAAQWCGSKFRGHPTRQMVERVVEEYQLADRIRVSSEWSRNSLVEHGVPAGNIKVLQQPVDLERFQPACEQIKQIAADGPLRICFVGSLDLRKGFVYLLRAIRLLGPQQVRLEIVGATGNRCCARLFERESHGLNLTASPRDPLPAYHRAEIFVLPTLEDGSPFAVAEAMACGLPVIVTDSCGAAEWVTKDRTGWIVPSRDPVALADALTTALRRRSDLKSMGAQARVDTERRAGDSCFTSFREWLNQN